MTIPSDEKKYPYSRNRVIINVVIAASSVILALFLLSSDAISILLYLMSTSVFVIATLLLKRILYPKVIAADSGQDDSASDKPTPFWRTAIPAFLLLLGFVAAPLLLAGFVPGIIWFITMIGFTTGIGVSEIIFYVQSKSAESSR